MFTLDNVCSRLLSIPITTPLRNQIITPLLFGVAAQWRSGVVTALCSGTPAHEEFSASCPERAAAARRRSRSTWQSWRRPGGAVSCLSTWTRRDPRHLGGGARPAGTPEMESATPDQLPALLETARKAGVDLAIIDTRPSVEADAAQVAALSDFLLIPTRPAILDLRAILATLDIVKGGTNRAALVLNACQPPRGSGEASATIDARNALRAFGVPVAAATVVQRAAFSQALVGGMTASETEPDGKAAKDMRALWRFVEKELFR